jgi:hypothetical protein
MKNRARLSDLHPQTRLDLIEESRWQMGSDQVNHCIKEDAFISEMCVWAKTRQGFKYWDYIDQKFTDPVLN